MGFRSNKSDATLRQVRTGADGFRDDLMSMRHELLSARHAAYHRVVGALILLVSGPDADPELVSRFDRAWKTRSFPTFYERPLLVLSALRADALEEGKRHPLHAAVAAAAPDPEAVTNEAVTISLARDRMGIWSTLTNRRVQTNDTTRAIAWLWPAYLAGCEGGKRPLLLADVGAAAGLNLIADRLPNVWKDRATGREIPCATRVETVGRVGFDPRLLGVQNADDVLWMRACIWAGDTSRLSRFEAAVQAMSAAMARPGRPIVERLTASLVPEWLRSQAAKAPPDTLLLAYQTLLRGYLDESERENYERGMREFLSSHVAGSAVWTELELDDGRRRLPAVLMAHVRAGNGVRSLRLGRCSQHPIEMDVDVAGVEELRRHLTDA
jgi:hypothetical protein